MGGEEALHRRLVGYPEQSSPNTMLDKDMPKSSMPYLIPYLLYKPPKTAELTHFSITSRFNSCPGIIEAGKEEKCS